MIVRNVILGLIVGAVLGMVFGVTVIAPRLKPKPMTGKVGETTIETPPQPANVAMQLSRELFARAEIEFKMASAFGSGLPVVGALAQRVDTETWRVSDGGIELRLFEPNALVPVGDMLAATASSAIDAAFASPALWSDEIPALRLFGAVPFGPAVDEYLAWIDVGGGRELLERIYHERGVHGLVCGLLGPSAGGWFRREIHAVEDFQGMPVAARGLGAKVLARLGAEPRSLDGSALFAAIETGEIDAVVDSAPAVDLPLGYQEYLTNLYFPGWQQPATVLDLIINLDKWNALTTTQKAQIEAVCSGNIRHGIAQSEAAQFAAIKQLHAGGVSLHRWPGQIQERLAEVWQEVVQEEAGIDDEFRAVWRSLKAFRAEYGIWQELSRP